MSVDASQGLFVISAVLAIVAWFLGGAKNHKELKNKQTQQGQKKGSKR